MHEKATIVIMHIFVVHGAMKYTKSIASDNNRVGHINDYVYVS